MSEEEILQLMKTHLSLDVEIRNRYVDQVDRYGKYESFNVVQLLLDGETISEVELPILRND